MINKEYESYKKACFGNEDVPPIQLKEIKQAFHAGAFSALNVLISGLETGMSEKMLNNTVHNMYRELKAELKP